MNEKKSVPEKKFGAAPISVAIWKNEGSKDGKSYQFYSVTLSRNYKDLDGKWKSTNNLRVADLPKAILVLNKSYEYLMFKGREPASEAADEVTEEVVY